jgi:hypothetical protein
LPHGAVDAFVLDDLHVAACARLLDPEKHGALNRDTTKCDSRLAIKVKITINVAPHFAKIRNPL